MQESWIKDGYFKNYNHKDLGDNGWIDLDKGGWTKKSVLIGKAEKPNLLFKSRDIGEGFKKEGNF